MSEFLNLPLEVLENAHALDLVKEGEAEFGAGLKNTRADLPPAISSGIPEETRDLIDRL